MNKLIFILLFFILFSPYAVFGAGVEASPSKIEILANGISASSELSVRNPSADVQLFEVYADEFSDVLKINPASFILEAGASKKVSIVFSVKQDKDKILKTNISVVARPMTDSRFQFNSGIKIPITISVSAVAQPISWWLCAIVAAIIIGIGASIFYIRKKKGQSINNQQ